VCLFASVWVLHVCEPAIFYFAKWGRLRLICQTSRLDDAIVVGATHVVI